ncbi:MAG: cell division protein FtsL [Butyrivibrio sp.]|nr:cell division protein FtsL [Acetatifactor muris]MCM1561257.1 cell division protein FtsL [Butyrivibrio sp.]
MSRNRRNYRQTAYEKRTGARAERNRNFYVYGSAAYETEAERQWEAEPRRQVQPAVRKNREKANHMSAGYVLFLAAALCAAAFILVNYIQLQADLTNLTKSVAAKQSELNTLRDANNEQYNRIVNSINLEEIKRIAIGELGMIYAQEGQIITYTHEGDDYMRQVPGSK